ncbi:putative RNA-directed DNA polymerase, eukaryota, reverse transcriptase zinc-binding domain protein [Tanacetum coccineum]
MWDSRVFNMEYNVTDRNFLGVIGSWSGVSSKVGLLNVYAPQLSSLKSKLWSTIEGVINFVDVIWILFGDFNAVRSQDEHLGSTFDVNEANSFNDFITRVGLFDFPLCGRRFTRFDNNGRSDSKLDRFMVSNKFFDFWNNALVFVLCRSLSDHCLIALKVGLPNFGPKPFRIFDKWIGVDGFQDIISSFWASHGSTFTPNLALKNKLKCLWQAIKVWTFNQTVAQNNLKEDLVQRDRFSQTYVQQPLFRKFSSRDAIYLDSIITMEEVKDAVWGYAGSKAPGLDGFNFNFIKSYWEIIKQDFWDCIKYFESTGRKILDGNLIANEVIRMTCIENLKLLLFKVDFEKAFDSVNWNFLLNIMRQIRFSLKWRKWISSCLSSASISVLINGSPSKEFKLERGLRQGYTLSPFLFLIVAEALQISILEAYDALFFGDWSRLNASNLIHILKWFELASGIKVNIAKSRLLGVGVPNIEVEFMASSLGCTHDSLPFTYLGLLVGKKMRACDGWDLILSRFRDRLSSWRAKSLSIGGRLTLVKSVLQSLPIYYLSLFNAPQKVIHILEAIRYRFFRGFKDSQRGICWVKCNTILLDRDKGGLGVVINEFYGNDWSFGSSLIAYHVGGIWHDIIKCGVGDRLKDSFPRLYALENAKDCKVADHWCFANDVWGGNWSRRLPPRGRAIDELSSLISLIGNLSLDSNGIDKWMWAV